MNTHKGMQIAAVGALAMALVTAAGCEVARQSAPPLSGPSSFGLSVTLSATPDRITQDGISTSTIRAVVQDASGKAVSGLGIQWDVRASDGSTFVEPSARTSVTDSSGRTSIQVTAPPAPTALPNTPVTLAVTATPLGDDVANAAPRQVNVALMPPLGTLPTNNNPTAVFTMVPAVANINQFVEFDASSTMDEGNLCGSRCTYNWDFGDFVTGNGVRVSHSYTLPASYIITLTVIDDRGGVASTTKTLVVNGPAAPVALFTVTPNTATAATTFAFTAAASTVGTGATIDTYVWDFGDGDVAQFATPATTHKYAAPGTYIVTLTIIDSLGRTTIKTATLLVT